jgi:hypothetical protein
MPTEFDGLEPVAIALDEIEVADNVRLSGIDLETGLRATVLVEKCISDHATRSPLRRVPTGLVLTLSIERFANDS